MQTKDAYCLSQYQDLGPLDGREEIRLVRHQIYGTICVKKRLSVDMQEIYTFLKSCTSPHIPQIYECILDNGTLIVVEAYIAGRNLEDVLVSGVFEEEKAFRIIVELCDALKVLHHASPCIVCRDLKAENIMLDAQDNVYIVDFDIARIFRDGKKRDTKLLGTAEYAAPEQYGFFQTDQRTDIYALGVLLNYMLLKKFPVEQMAEGGAGQIIKKCTCLEPRERYQTVEELTDAIFKQYPHYFETPCEADFVQIVNEQMQTQEQNQKKWKRFSPPGFRSKTPWKMLTAVFGYMMIAYLCFSMEIEMDGQPLTGVQLRVEQTILFVSQLVFVAFVFDYAGCRDHGSFFHPHNLFLRILLYVAAEFFLLFVAVVVALFAELFF